MSNRSHSLQINPHNIARHWIILDYVCTLTMRECILIKNWFGSIDINSVWDTLNGDVVVKVRRRSPRRRCTPWTYSSALKASPRTSWRHLCSCSLYTTRQTTEGLVYILRTLFYISPIFYAKEARATFYVRWSVT